MERCSSAIGGHPGKTHRPDGREHAAESTMAKMAGGLPRKCSTVVTEIARWERYRILSGLHLRNAGSRVSTFLHAMGRETEDFFTNRRQRPIFLHLMNTTSEKAIQPSQASG
ncbi:hypothetical protein IscW_ISCW023065 [Ixodes scapularis]|uniref:Uncharacterized protein n=1 Tax=Ixodes scapularis TaxID=6945 RepID=B7QLX8_IXOSC|nr:hypothetical protein IscW_ISCW023065 [Ixodes scapularis]|eukprot:XP_002416183.1 hypothetical protein IscW_ISCW023065 [Ixodes scapularis]